MNQLFDVYGQDGFLRTAKTILAEGGQLLCCLPWKQATCTKGLIFGYPFRTRIMAKFAPLQSPCFIAHLTLGYR